MKKLHVLVACEFSGVVREAFRKLGHDAWSCDLLPCDPDNIYHITRDVLTLLKGRTLQFKTRTWVKPWDLMIGHPPCTFLCNSGVRWLYKGGKYWQPDGQGPLPLGIRGTIGGEKDPVRWKNMVDAASFFTKLQSAKIPHIAIENPIPHHWACLPEHDQIIQPWQFGHGETKATCLWLKNLPPLKPTDVVTGRVQRIHRMPPGPDRWKERSKTFFGIAEAMANQWSEYIQKLRQ